MNKITFLSFFCAILLLSAVLCGLAGELKPDSAPAATFDEVKAEPVVAAQPTSTEAETEPEIKVTAAEPVELEKGGAKVIELDKNDSARVTKWTSDDESIAEVDSGGRVDGKKEGKTTVTAELEGYEKIECEVSVTKAKKSEYDGYSTCIIANTDVVSKNKKNKSRDLYQIQVNRKQNCVTVYTYNKDGVYNVPVRAMVCSCGEDNGTITGEFSIYFQREWNALYQGVYGHYVSGISGDYLFHSVPYYAPAENRLEVEEFNKLGESASLGCVRMASADVKWIYDNCPMGTRVSIYDDKSSPGPLGKPEAIKITDNSCGWDPTDSDKKNPYNDKTPEIKGAKDCTLKVGDEFYPLTGVSAKDTCSNDITDRIEVTGNVVTSRAGEYKVTYYVEDAMHRSQRLDITVKVENAN